MIWYPYEQIQTEREREREKTIIQSKAMIANSGRCFKRNEREIQLGFGHAVGVDTECVRLGPRVGNHKTKSTPQQVAFVRRNFNCKRPLTFRFCQNTNMCKRGLRRTPMFASKGARVQLRGKQTLPRCLLFTDITDDKENNF